MQTRAQRHLILAESCVSEVEKLPQETKNVYGGLCHSFPVLVRTNGLCQALAFSAAKGQSGGDRGDAHKRLLLHVWRILNGGKVPPANASPLDDVRKAPTLTYLRQTREVLDAWIYFKRFAVSVLKVDTGDQQDKT